jgi:beta-N-acetylhexosaminidase
MHVKVWIRIVPVVILVTLVTLGCNTSMHKHKEIDIRGHITNIAGNDTQKVLLIEGLLEKDTKYDKAIVTVTDKTKIYNGNEKDPVGYEALTTRIKVEAVFTGPVRESYPVQVTAKEIIILK